MKLMLFWCGVLILAGCTAQSRVPEITSVNPPNSSDYFLAQRTSWSDRRDARVPVRWFSDGSACWIGGGVDRIFNLQGHASLGEPPEPDSRTERRRPARGRQLDSAPSPDGSWVSVSENNNIVLRGVDSDRSQVVTTEGTDLIKYGTASWVYGEELDVEEAMWWRGDSQGIVYYRFDDTDVPQYPLTVNMTSVRPQLSTEAYPKPGDPNPLADLEHFDLESGERWILPTQPELEPDEPWYIYGVTCHGDHELLFHRTDRRQQRWELVWVDLLKKVTRVVLSEFQPCWHENNPDRRFLSDGVRFIHQSQQSGWMGWQLCSLTPGVSPVALTPPGMVAGEIVSLNEQDGRMRFVASAQPDLPLHQQLFEVALDGTGLRCLSPEAGHHVITHAPAGDAFVAAHQSIGTPPEIRLHCGNGDVHTLVARPTSLDADATSPIAQLVSTTIDGVEIFGVLHLPAGHGGGPFPLLVDVYGGPHSLGFNPRYQLARPENSLGIATLKIASRGTTGQSKGFQDAVYEQLGTVDLGDQAALAAHVAARPDIDESRVGIYGFSYGGYLSALGLLKHPEVFRFAVSGAPVVDWRYYDSIYTERYMGLPDENPDGYQNGSCLEHVNAPIGPLLLIHGAVDDNVHVSNAFALMDLLQQKRYPFEFMLYPRSGHGLPQDGSRRMWDFLLRQCFP